MLADLLQLAASLARGGAPFVLATVVRREPASSTQVGNTALITERGEFHGWLGGSCIQPAVVREALAALRDGAPRLISLSPDPDAGRRPGVTVFPMTCHSGGSVDIYVEPIMPPPRLVVFGLSPIAQALARLGKAMGYAVDAVDRGADATTFPDADRVIVDLGADELLKSSGRKTAQRFAVVATLGDGDDEEIEAALAMEPAYLGVVASRRRYARVREALLARGVAPEVLDSVRNPAGLDIGARAPEEIALSILAEIVQARRASLQPPPPVEDATTAREERDPVCGMLVNASAARHTAEHGGRTYYFCCGGCRKRFLETPERFAVALLS